MTSATRTNGRPRTPRVIQAESEQLHPGGLADALLAFAAEAPKLTRDQPGRIGSREYMYTSIDSLLDDVAPLLLKHELLWTAKPTLQDGQAAALYRMTHVPSGDYDEWAGPLPCVEPGPQALGSAITYMRRYTLVAYLNLAPGDDDDGAMASPLQAVDRYAETAAAHAESASTVRAPATTAAPAQPSEASATGRQKGAINGRCANAGVNDSEQKAILQWVAGVAILDRVSKTKASELIKRLGDSGSGARAILDEITAQSLNGDERARAIALRYFEAP